MRATDGIFPRAIYATGDPRATQGQPAVNSSATDGRPMATRRRPTLGRPLGDPWVTHGQPAVNP